MTSAEDLVWINPTASKHLLTPGQQDELSEKILDAVTLEEIHAWLKSIRGN